MKSLFHKKLLILYLVTSCSIFVSCGNISESNLSYISNGISDSQSNTDKSDDMNKQLWKVVIIKETTPSNYNQKIIIVDESGTIYRHNCSDVNESFHIQTENWQEQLALICNSSNTVERLSDDDLTFFAEYMENIYQYKEENIKTQKSQLKDYGTTVVYGIDYNNSIPEYTMICKYGSEISCIDNDITKKFGNELVRLQLLQTMGYTFE